MTEPHDDIAPGEKVKDAKPSLQRPAPLVRAAERTLRIIELFANEQRPMSNSEIAQRLDIPVSTSHGLMKTLESLGYAVELGRHHTFYPSQLLHIHAKSIAQHDPLLALLGPTLRQLRDQSGETVLLAKLVGREAVYLEMMESPASLRYIANIGDRRPLTATAAGKALLGAMKEDQRLSLLRKLQLNAATKRTILDRQELKTSIDEGIRRGWFVTDGEFLDEVAAIAVPLTLDQDLFAMVIAGPSGRIRPRIEELGTLLVRSRDQLATL